VRSLHAAATEETALHIRGTGGTGTTDDWREGVMSETNIFSLALVISHRFDEGRGAPGGQVGFHALVLSIRQHDGNL
jgi:hypothetical protein